MSYHLECQVCTHQVEVAESSAKLDQCPECSSFFTMMPATPRPKASVANLLRHSDPNLHVASPAPPAPPSAAPGPRLVAIGTAAAVPPPREPTARITPSSKADWPLAAPSSAAPIPKGALIAPRKPAQPDSWIDTRPEPPASEPKRVDPDSSTLLAETKRTRRRAKRAAAAQQGDAQEVSILTDPAGPGALLVGVAALLCAWVPRLTGLVVPLAVFGLLWGVIAAIVAGSVNRPRRRAVIGAVTSCVALIVAFMPGSDSRSTGAPGGASGSALPVVAPMAGPDWADASRGQKLGEVHLQVVSITVGTADPPPPSRTGPKDKKAAKAPAGPEKVLLVRLRAERPSGASPTGPIWREKPDAVLSDDGGRTFPIRPAAAAKLAGPATAGSAETVVAFVAPARVRKFLRLEVPATAVGETGTFRFTVQPDMIADEPTLAGAKASP